MDFLPDPATPADCLISPVSDPNHFDPHGCREDVETPTFWCFRITDRKRSFADGRQILNCTVGGALELLKDRL